MSYLVGGKPIISNDVTNGIDLDYGQCNNAFVKGKELQDRRENMGMSREELATALQTTAVTVWRWENEERAIPPYLELALQTIERQAGKKGLRRRPRPES